MHLRDKTIPGTNSDVKITSSVNLFFLTNSFVAKEGLPFSAKMGK